MSLLALVMLVKNEARSIGRTIASVSGGLVDALVLLDTGSTDGTQEIARAACAANGIAFHLFEEPFVDFAASRNRALELAGPVAEWHLMLSGDELVTSENALRCWLHDRLGLDDEAFDVAYRFGGDLSGASARLTRTRSAYRYHGVTHEVVVHPDAKPITQRAPVTVHYDPEDLRTPEGRETFWAAKRERWELDVALLRRSAVENPENPRTIFYLAQTYGCLGNAEAAHWLYVQRLQMGGFAEELYEATYRIAECASLTGWPRAYVERRLHDAHLMRPHRAEPLYRIAYGRFNVGDVDGAYPFALAACERAVPRDKLMHDRHVYEWKASDLLAEIAITRGDHGVAERAILRALGSEIIPRADRYRLERWLGHVQGRAAA